MQTVICKRQAALEESKCQTTAFEQALTLSFRVGKSSLVFDRQCQTWRGWTFLHAAAQKGSLYKRWKRSERTECNADHRSAEKRTPSLSGNWFNDGFCRHRASSLNAIEQNREPDNGAQRKSAKPRTTFAAIKSAQ